MSKWHARLGTGVAVSAVVGLTTMFLFLHWRNGELHTVLNEANQQSSSDNVVHKPARPVEDELPIVTRRGSESNSELHPSDACERPLRELSEECLESLDTYFLDKPFVWKDFDWLPLPLTYQRIFADPTTDRGNVLSALERSECRLEEGEVRWDLKESCHAESFTNYANFLYFCQYVEEKLDSDLDMAQNFFYGSAFWPNVWQRYSMWDLENPRLSEWAGERLLEGRWIVERTCKRFDTETLSLDPQHYATLMDIWKRLEEDTGAYDRAFEVLRSMAARLGDEWASIVYTSRREHDVWNTHESKNMPWKHHLRTMRSAMSKPSVETGSDARDKALSFALVVWGELEEAGIRVDLDRLVDYVCGGNWRRSKDTCEDTISELKENEVSTDQDYWHRLSEFEARAIQIGLYDVLPTYRGVSWESKELRALDRDGFHAKWKGKDDLVRE